VPGAPQSTGAADAAPTAPAPRVALNEVTATRGDSLWSIAEEALAERLGRPATASELDRYWSSVVEINRGRLVDPADPGLIYSGQRFVLP